VANWIRSPGRRREVIGLLAGLTAGFCLVLGWLAVSGPGRPVLAGATGPRATDLRATDPAPAVPGAAAGAPDPAALDAEWTALSDRSGCADWAGGDGVSAIRLNSAQLAWFFSDTYLGPAGPLTGFSRSSGFAHNSVVIQTTDGPGSSFVTMTGGGACTVPGRPLGPPSDVVASQGKGSRYWDEDGLDIDGTVVKFYNSYQPGGVPFIPAGTVIATFPASSLSTAGRGSAYGAVARPRIIALPSYVPPSGGSPVVWGAALLVVGHTVYVYGTQSQDPAVPDRQLYLARVTQSRLTTFGAWQFYAGPGRWAAAQDDARPVRFPGGGQLVPSGFSVVRAAGRYWFIAAGAQPGDQDIDAYPAAAPWGPFDTPAGLVLFRDPDVGLDPGHDYRIMYEARAEPALSAGGSLVISYNVNSEAVTTGCVPLAALTNTLTQPRFIAVPWSVFGDRAGRVVAGPSSYPGIVAADPGQWFDSWQYPAGCPPVPAVAAVRDQTQSGAVTLSWPDAGLGVRYQVWLLIPGTGTFTLARTVRSDDATISGLAPGLYLARVVPANFRQSTGPPAELEFTVPLTRHRRGAVGVE
jgi:hypothetical protein